LFIPGSGGDLRARPGVFDWPLVRHFQVLSYDQRGLGRSDKPPGPYSMAQYADDAAGLLEAVGWPQALVVGYSFGGMVAQELALRHPGRVKRLVLISTTAGGAGGSSYPLHELAELSLTARARRLAQLSDLHRHPAWQQAHPARFEEFCRQWLAELSLGADEPGRAQGLRWQLEARRHHDTWDRLPSLSVPTLVCAGRHDGIAPRQAQEALARRIPGARLAWFDGGHRFFLRDPTAWPTIVAFLQARGQGAESPSRG
jgi:3-oxoadipate enol-lactonase